MDENPVMRRDDDSPGVAPFDWRTPFERLYAEVVGDAWRLNYRNQISEDFQPEFMRWLYRRETDLLFVSEAGKRFVGFFGGSRQTIRLAGIEREAYLGTLFAVCRDRQRQGIGYRLFTALSREARHRGALHLFFMERGQAASKVLKQFAAREAFAVVRLARLNFSARIFSLALLDRAEPLTGVDRFRLWGPVRRWIESQPERPAVAGAVRPYRAEDLPACLALLNAYAADPRLKLARVWTSEELGRELAFGKLARTYVYEWDGKVRGLVNYYLVQMRGRVDFATAFINNLAWGDLTPREKRALIAEALVRMKAEGCEGALVCNFGYCDVQPLAWARFLPWPRQIDFYAAGDPVQLRGLRTLRPDEIYYCRK